MKVFEFMKHHDPHVVRKSLLYFLIKKQVAVQKIAASRFPQAARYHTEIETI
jgi:hypothetical protein